MLSIYSTYLYDTNKRYDFLLKLRICNHNASRENICTTIFIFYLLFANITQLDDSILRIIRISKHLLYMDSRSFEEPSSNMYTRDTKLVEKDWYHSSLATRISQENRVFRLSRYYTLFSIKVKMLQGRRVYVCREMIFRLE